MAFTMRLLKCYKHLACWVFFSCLPLWGYGAGFSTEVKQADVVLQNDEYVLSAQINYHLSEKAKSALQSGVPLYWDLQVKVKQTPSYLWSKTWLIVVKRYRLQYHALLNLYRLKNEEDGVGHNFSTLASALELMSVVTDLPIIKKAELDPELHYVCLVKLNFERDALPLPLRPIAYIDSRWNLSSDWTAWPLKK